MENTFYYCVIQMILYIINLHQAELFAGAGFHTIPSVHFFAKEYRMNNKPNFIGVGENIHCTRIFKVGGVFAKANPDGSGVIMYKDGGTAKELPVPQRFVNGEDWKNGKVKHAAVAMWQSLHGDEKGKKAGTDYLKYMAREQEAKGAAFLDLNVDEYSTDVKERIELIQWVARIIQQDSSHPLSIDSSNIDILTAGLEACDRSKGKPMVNSVSLEREGAIDIAKKAGAVVIAGATGRDSMPTTKEERMANLKELVGKLTKARFGMDEIYLDPLIFPVSVNSQNGVIVFETIKELRNLYGNEIHFAPGLSNISFGLPNRKLINQVFTYLCYENGCDGGIVDPAQINNEVLAALDPNDKAFKLTKALLLGEDEYGMEYIAACRDGAI